VSEAAAEGATIACLGLAFKADIDDLRESPAVEVTRLLSEARPDAKLLAVEPHVDGLPAALDTLHNVAFSDLATVLDVSDVILLLVDHAAFGDVDQAQLAGKTVFDTRGMWREIA
jgi:UDP-N-acetyl-D-mannosaminuronic acid dehydrogenase